MGSPGVRGPSPEPSLSSEKDELHEFLEVEIDSSIDTYDLTSSDAGPCQVHSSVHTGGKMVHRINVPLTAHQEITFATLMTMNEADLKAIGLDLFGPRRKISMAISK